MSAVKAKECDILNEINIDKDKVLELILSNRKEVSKHIKGNKLLTLLETKLGQSVYVDISYKNTEYLCTITIVIPHRGNAIEKYNLVVSKDAKQIRLM